MKLIAFIPLFVLCACADTHAFVALEGTHASHISQHFRSRPTNYGYDAISVSMRLESPHGPFVEVAEGYILESRWRRASLSGAGGMLGPSELTQITVGYRWRVW